MKIDRGKYVADFALETVDLQKIINIATKTEEAEIVEVSANTICISDINMEQCKQYSFQVTKNGDFASVMVQKPVNDDSLLFDIGYVSKNEPGGTGYYSFCR